MLSRGTSVLTGCRPAIHVSPSADTEFSSKPVLDPASRNETVHAKLLTLPTQRLSTTPQDPFLVHEHSTPHRQSFRSRCSSGSSVVALELHGQLIRGSKHYGLGRLNLEEHRSTRRQRIQPEKLLLDLVISKSVCGPEGITKELYFVKTKDNCKRKEYEF